MNNDYEITAKQIPYDIKYSGISIKDHDFQFDFDKDTAFDIIKLVSYELQCSKFKNNVYWLGYQFEPNASSRERTTFINALKGINSESLSEREFRHFVELPMNSLSCKVNSYKITNFVYPLSGRSQLVSRMIKIITEWLSRNVEYCEFELVKKAPINIDFNWKEFRAHLKDNPNYLQMINHVKEEILPSIHSLDYFSLAHNVKPKYRPYIKNYLGFPDLNKLEQFASLKGERILVIDDINTSGSTLNEILRILNEINDQCKIYVYTLIGKY